MKKKRGWSCLLVSGIVLAALACIVLLGGWLGMEEFKNTPRLVSDFYFNYAHPSPYTYSSTQQDYVNSYGEPESFYILFYQREGVTGNIESVRYEEWSYYGEGFSVIFENGEYTQADEIPVEQVLPSPYQPSMFTAFLSRELISKAADLDEWLIVPVEAELMMNADLYYAQNLTFGLQNDELVYIEALALVEP